jgi:hypothetical protein
MVVISILLSNYGGQMEGWGKKWVEIRDLRVVGRGRE